MEHEELKLEAHVHASMYTWKQKASSIPPKLSWEAIKEHMKGDKNVVLAERAEIFQQQGIDCDETFSLVVKPATIQTVFSLAGSQQWPIHQLDMKNAFLYRHLVETRRGVE
ncbi:ribonuclease H-like domain-containing protein [Tanacetum coccineum]